MARRIEQGNIVGFVLVGVLLAALLAGGIFLVRNHFANRDTNETQSTNQTVANKDEEKTEADKAVEEALANQAAQERKAEEQLEAKKNEPSTPPAAEVETTPQTGVSNLPTTGPADTMWVALGVMSLAGVGLAYFRSRKLI